MPAPIYDHLRESSTEKLLVLLEFFDHPRLRQYYTGLLDDVRRELAERGLDAEFLEDLRLSIQEGLDGDVITEAESLARVARIAAAKEKP